MCHAGGYRERDPCSVYPNPLLGELEESDERWVRDIRDRCRLTAAATEPWGLGVWGGENHAHKDEGFFLRCSLFSLAM